MKEKIIKKYELWKKTLLDECEKEIIKIKCEGDETTLRDAVYRAERYEMMLRGMIYLMESVGVITYKEVEEEKGMLEEMFSTKRLYGAFVSHSESKLVLCVSEIKKGD